MIKLKDSNGNEVFAIEDEGKVLINGKEIQDMNEITEAVKEAQAKEEE